MTNIWQSRFVFWVLCEARLDARVSVQVYLLNTRNRGGVRKTWEGIQELEGSQDMVGY